MVGSRNEFAKPKNPQLRRFGPRTVVLPHLVYRRVERCVGDRDSRRRRDLSPQLSIETISGPDTTSFDIWIVKVRHSYFYRSNSILDGTDAFDRWLLPTVSGEAREKLMTIRAHRGYMATTGNGENMECVRNGSATTGTSSGSSADRAFDVLADAGRRAVIDALSEDGSATVEDLAGRLASRHASETRAKLALVHRHLPKLRDAGVITYDPGARVVELDDAGDVLAVLGTVSDRID